jgi:hypothetical protein
MNAAESLLYRHIPSFKREHGGLHSLYATAYSWIYSTRMHRLHRRGLHGRSPHGTGPCQWCGESADR